MRELIGDWRVRLIAALGAGPIAAAGFAPVSIPFLLLVGLFILFVLVEESENRRQAGLYGWLWGIGYFAVGLAWTYRSMHEFGQLPSLFAATAVVLLGAFLALIPGLSCWLARLLPVGRLVRLAIVLPSSWVLGEWVRGSAVMGFGWLSSGYAFVDSLFGAWAPVAGLYGVSWVLVSLVGGVAALFYCEKGPWRKSALALFVGGLAVSSVALDEVTWSRPSGNLDVRVVQPALPIVMRADARTEPARLDRMKAMSARSAMGSDLDLIVWPESVYVWPIDRLRDTVTVPSDVSAYGGADILFNAFAVPEPDVYYNAMWHVTEGKLPQQVYAKMHLVPFGEFVPFGFRWFVDALGIPMADQTRGTIPTEPLRVAGVEVATQVCYENLFGEELRDWWTVSNPALIVNTANLGWFAPFVAEQFTQMSQMRARETARPYVQAQNQSHSALIDAKGRIERLTWPGAQNLDVRVTLQTGEPTPFVRFGNGPIVVWTLVLLLGALVVSRRQNQKSHKRVK